MGIRLFVEVLEYAPDTLTWRERYALTVLAETANDSTRECWPGIEDDPTIARRMRLPGRSSRYEVLRGLREKKALESVSAGRRGHRAVYRIADLTSVQGPGTADPMDPMGSGNPGLSVRETRTQTEEKGPGTADPKSEKGSGNDLHRVRERPSQGPGSTDPFPSTPSVPSRSNKSSPAASSPDRETAAAGTDQHLEAFGAFWLIYPKKKAREEAKKAWIAALARGADPQHLVTAATGYAKERASEDPKFTKYPATWLNKGCYDDEPEQPDRPHLRAVSGNGYRPFQLPADVDYSKGF